MEQRTQKTGVRKQATGFGSGSVRFPSRSQNEHAEAAKQKVAVRKADVSSSRRSSHIQHPQGIKTRACIQEQSQKLEQGPGDTCRQEGALETGEDRAGVEEKGEKEENDQTLSVSESAPEKASLKSMGLQMKVEAEKKSQLTAEGKGGGARVSEWGGAQRSNQAEQLAHGSGEEDGVKWWRGWAAQDGDGREAGDSEEQRADWVDRERAHFEWQQRAWAKKERLWGEEERLCEDEIALRREENERRRARMEREEELWRQAQQQQHQGGAAHIERFSGSKRGAESQAGEQGGDKRQRVEGELPADAQHAGKTTWKDLRSTMRLLELQGTDQKRKNPQSLNTVIVSCEAQGIVRLASSGTAALLRHWEAAPDYALSGGSSPDANLPRMCSRMLRPLHADRAFAHAKEGPVGRRQEAAAPEKVRALRSDLGAWSMLASVSAAGGIERRVLSLAGSSTGRTSEHAFRPSFTMQ